VTKSCVEEMQKWI